MSCRPGDSAGRNDWFGLGVADETLLADEYADPCVTEMRSTDGETIPPARLP